MNIYQVDGLRHHAIVFAKRPEEAIEKTMSGGEMSSWEMPEARPVSLPKGYAIRPVRQGVEWLRCLMEEGWETLRRRVVGLTDAEFFWQPVPDGWTLREVNGKWELDYADPAPEPPPVTTIAWRMAHLAACKLIYYEYAFGDARLTWDMLDLPHTAADALEWLAAQHTRLTQALEEQDDASLDRIRKTHWGEVWPTWRIFTTLAAHDLHHGGEIGLLRDLYFRQRKE